MTRRRATVCGLIAAVATAGAAAGLAAPTDANTADADAAAEMVVHCHQTNLTMSWRISRLETDASEPAKYEMVGESVGGSADITARLAPMRPDRSRTMPIADGVAMYENGGGDRMLAFTHSESRAGDSMEFLVVDLGSGSIAAEGRINEPADQVGDVMTDLRWGEMIAMRDGDDEPCSPTFEECRSAAFEAGVGHGTVSYECDGGAVHCSWNIGGNAPDQR